MLDESAEEELRDAIEARLNARREAARRRREGRERFAADKQTRRTAGLRARHETKLARNQNKES